MMSNAQEIQKKIVSSEKINSIFETIRKSGKTVAMCHGVFDLVHPGHIAHFEAAMKFADLLVVSITADKFVNKGPGRPLFTQEVRANSIAALVYVDYVVVSNSATALEMISIVKPNYYVKGSDYSNESEDVTGMISKERAEVELHGGELVFTDELTSSSSKLINNYFSNLTNEAQTWLQEFKQVDGLSQVEKWLTKIQDKKVLIAGETIIDRYTVCNPLAKSSKDPILAFQIGESHSFPGGVLAIANNCKSWASNVSVVTFLGENPNEAIELFKTINPELHIHNVSIAGRPTILKHRFVDEKSNFRVFEFYDFANKDLRENEYNEIGKMLGNELATSDVLIAADYGHGFFGNKLISQIAKDSTFLAVNTQSNAGNRGYNTISRYPRADLVCLNSGELELEYRERNLDFRRIVPEILNRMSASYGVVTLGGDGLLIFGKNGEYSHVPAFATKVIDKVGAGDAVLAMASLLASVGATVEVIGFVANLVAAHEVSQLGHQSSLTLGAIRKQAKAILG